MADISPEQRAAYESDFGDAEYAINDGVVAPTAHKGRKYWNHWTEYAEPLHIDPYLQTFGPKEIKAICGYIARVRTGHYGYGSQFKRLKTRFVPSPRKSNWLEG